ncbi:hypothetical protein TWF730_008996 [Orbilia blumenaviensis]|uniref:Peptidase S8/S53 domain-containing protein n=1 Tax=Orbilia blumenaviensis TaxID=1796055 RepID=A0AAV9V0A4_9PEZI
MVLYDRVFADMDPELSTLRNAFQSDEYVPLWLRPTIGQRAQQTMTTRAGILRHRSERPTRRINSSPGGGGSYIGGRQEGGIRRMPILPGKYAKSTTDQHLREYEKRDLIQGNVTGDGVSWYWNSYVQSEPAAGALPSILTISQPPGLKITDQNGKFWNFEDAGEGVIIYVVDRSFDLDYPDLANTKIMDVIYAGKFSKTDLAFDIIDGMNNLRPQSRGGAIVGQIAGEAAGTARDANIVVVETEDGRGALGDGMPDPLIDALLKVYDHIKAQGPHAKCVINLSLGVSPEVFERLDRASKLSRLDEDLPAYSMIEGAFIGVLRTVITQLLKLPNVVLAVAAGDEENTAINTWPALFGKEPFFQYYNNRMVVVGGYDPYTGANMYQSSSWVKVWAPARDVHTLCKVRRRWGRRPYEVTVKPDACLSNGTSGATAAVSSVLASWLSAGGPMRYLVSFMYDQAYPRVEGGPNALYNGIPLDEWSEDDLRASWFSPLSNAERDLESEAEPTPTPEPEPDPELGPEADTHYSDILDNYIDLRRRRAAGYLD